MDFSILQTKENNIKFDFFLICLFYRQVVSIITNLEIN